MPKQESPQTAAKRGTEENEIRIEAIESSANSDLFASQTPGVWNDLAITKFRAPLRRGLVSRPALLHRACSFAQERRVCLICAPAGFGKSTLLVQMFAQLSMQARGEEQIECAWLSLDEHDNDINRLLVSLLGALRGVALEWEVAPNILVSQVQRAGPQSHAAVAAIINALASYQGERLLLILDDLHRVSDADALNLLGDLIDRLPPEISIAIGSRVEPAIPLARWRARGDLVEIGVLDLQFTSDDIRALAQLQHGQHWNAEDVQHALQRTEGWAAGLQLILAASGKAHVVGTAKSRAGQRHLFDFFAQEVVADLSDELREFVLQCSILPELSPALCNAVTGRSDAQTMLASLFRRNLFLTALDESLQVLRFHDLFAEFLQAQLVQRSPSLVKALHARAARVEPNPTRAVTHWLNAEQWHEAIATMMECAETLLAEGGVASVMRWLAQLPEAITRDSADVAYLQALCALGLWRFMHAAAYFDRAVEGYRASGNLPALMRCIALLPRTCVAFGQMDRAAQALREADTLPMPLPLQVIRDSGRVWLAAAREPDACAPALEAIAEHATRDPRFLLPAVNDMFVAFMFALPNAMPQMLRLRELCRRQLAAGVVHWQLEAMTCTPWAELWHGERQRVNQAFEHLAQTMDRLSIVPMLALMTNGSRATLAACHGDFSKAIRLLETNLQITKAMNDEGFTRTWHRFAIVVLAHYCWMAGDAAALEAHWPEMSAERTVFEWPMFDTCRALLRGRIALLAGRFDEAEAVLQEAVRLQALGRALTWTGDARCSLAICYQRRGREDLAREAFAPVFEEVLKEDCIGFLLMESAQHHEGLLSLLPAELRAQPRTQELIARLAAWRVTDDIDMSAQNSNNLSLVTLSTRELEVLACIAAGDSNKQIAKNLDLSSHTVKRHVANILAKLDCDTRGQAAARWRTAHGDDD